MNILLTSPSMSMAIVALVETCILPLSEKNHPFFLCMQPLFYAKYKTITQHVGKAVLLLNMSVTPTSTALTPREDQAAWELWTSYLHVLVCLRNFLNCYKVFLASDWVSLSLQAIKQMTLETVLYK